VRFEIRPATRADRAGVEEIVRQAYEPWVVVVGGRPAPMDADYAALIAAGRVHVTGAEPDAIDGLIVLIPERGVLLVENVAVRPTSHGQGIGRALLEFAEDEARRRGLAAIRLFTHERMAGNVVLYERLGYVETGTRAVPGGNLVDMRKQLDER
jgi:GNAT superfamily N-acetyltransferase